MTLKFCFWFEILLWESKKGEHFYLTLMWSNRKKNSQETKIYTLFLQKNCAKIAINKYRGKMHQFLAKENPSIKSKCSRFSDSHSKTSLICIFLWPSISYADLLWCQLIKPIINMCICEIAVSLCVIVNGCFVMLFNNLLLIILLYWN